MKYLSYYKIKNKNLLMKIFITFFLSCTKIILLLFNMQFGLFGQELCPENEQIAYNVTINNTTTNVDEYRTVLTSNADMGNYYLRYNKKGVFNSSNVDILKNEFLRSNTGDGLPYFMPICTQDVEVVRYEMAVVSSSRLDIHNLQESEYDFAKVDQISTSLFPPYKRIQGFWLERNRMYLTGMNGNKLWSVSFRDNRRHLMWYWWNCMNCEPDAENLKSMYINANGATVETKKRGFKYWVELRYDPEVENSFSVYRYVQDLDDVNSPEPEERKIYNTELGHLTLIEFRRLEERIELITNLDVKSFISSNDDDIVDPDFDVHGSLLLNEEGNNTHVLRVLKDRFEIASEQHFDETGETEEPSELISYTFPNPITDEGALAYINTSTHGRMLIKNSKTKETHASLGDNCLTPEPGSEHKTVLSEDENDKPILRALTKNGHEVWNFDGSSEKVKCTFPAIGYSEIKLGEKLVEHDLPNPAENEKTYLMNDDFILIKKNNIIKLISKENFINDGVNGNPTQEYKLSN